MTDIATLFARDPHDLTEQDLDLIIQRYREARAQFNAGAKAAGKPPAKKSAPQKKQEHALNVVGELKLDDI